MTALTVLMAMIACTGLGVLLGSTLSSGRRTRGVPEVGDPCDLVTELRSQVRELGRLYNRPAGAVRDDHPRAAVGENYFTATRSTTKTMAEFGGMLPSGVPLAP